MFLEKVHSAGLAHVSYLIGSGGAAAVVDPRLDGEVYVEMAAQRGARITHIFETHRNEDYIIGSRPLAGATGAEVFHGRALDFSYGTSVRENDSFALGNLDLTVLETPGHTYESISIVARDTAYGQTPVAVFTGDALFIGDAGRTDFFPDRKEETAGLLYESIFEKLLPLGDQTIVCPAHGAGSVCGGGIASREFSTLGYERQHNPMLHLERSEFIDKKVSEHHYIPPYFKRMERFNIGELLPPAHIPRPAPCDADAFARCIDRDGMIVVDTRSPEAVAGAYIDGSYTIPLNMLPAFAGWFLPPDRPIGLLVERYTDVDTAVRSLLRVGYDRVGCFLDSGMHGWEISGRTYSRIPAVHVEELKNILKDGDSALILDVRSIDEFESGHLPDAQHIYVGELPQRLGEIPRDRPIITFCGSGRRAIIAAALLKNSGFDDVSDCLGSMRACTQAGCPVVY